MDFELSEEQQLLVQTVREFAQEELAPYVAEHDRDGIYPADAIKKAAELGFMGMMVPAEYGGVEMGNLSSSLLIEEISRVSAAVGVILSVHNSLICGVLAKYGTPEQKNKYLPKLASGEFLGAYSLSEADAGTHASNLKCKAEAKGDHYLLNGTKLWVTSGAQAGLFIIFTRTSWEDKESRGITAFLVEPTFEGFSVGTKEEKMGIRSSSTTELILENCKVPAGNLLGEKGKGFHIAMDGLDGGRIGVGSQALGIGQACLDASIKYAKERIQFDRPIAEFQAVQWKLAEMATQLEGARLLLRRAAVLRDRNLPCSKESSMGKLMASRACVMASNEAVQIHGGAGYTKEFPVERFYRDARITEIYEGTTEAQKIVISSHLLK
jgi:alkylation response protein AidB-like acyl-CoA dehydrogenase